MLRDFIHNKFSPKPKFENKAKALDKVRLTIPEQNTPETPIERASTARSSSPTERFSSESDSVKEKSPNSKKEKGSTATHIKEMIQEFIGHFDHAPHFVKDNQYIHTGYRINFSTPKKILKSLFMVHNESVNIWSHLGGALFLIVLCIALCFSVATIDTKKVKDFVEVEVKELFEPIYSRLSQFSELENLSEKISQTKEDAIQTWEDKLQSLSNEISQVKQNINPEAIGRLLNSLKDELEAFYDQKYSTSLGLDIKNLEQIARNLKSGLDELENELIRQIDSSNFDWIDIYKYIHTTHTPLVSLSRWPIIIFLLCAVFCLLCSAIFHLFYCQNEKVFEFYRKFDYAGISILITGSCFPPFVYGFYCQPFFSQLYLSIIGVTSLIVFFVTLSDKIHTEAYIHWKAVMYGGLGIFAGLPIIHLMYLHFSSAEGSLNFGTSIPYYLAMGVSYLGGLAFYATKCPERYKPGSYDICGHSHQIWHVCVLLGVIFTYFGAFDNYYTRLETPCFA